MAKVKKLSITERGEWTPEGKMVWKDHFFNRATVMFHSFLFVLSLITTTFALLNILYTSSVFINMLYLSVSIFICAIASLIFTQNYQIQRTFHKGKQLVIKVEGRDHRKDINILEKKIHRKYPGTRGHGGVLSLPGLLKDKYHRILDLGGSAEYVIRLVATEDRLILTCSQGAKGHVDELTSLVGQVVN